MNINMPVSNAPMSSGGSGGSMSMFQTWITAVTKPNVQTYAAIAADPNAKQTTAYLWVFIGNLVAGILLGLGNGARYSSLLGQYGGSSLGGSVVGTLVYAICGGPIFAVLATIFFAIFMYIFQWIAKMFGGTGTVDKMAYTLAAIAVPANIVSGVLGLLGAIPYVGICFGIVSALVLIYVIVLNVMGVMGSQNLGALQAIGTLFIPALVFGCLCGCIIGVGFAAMGSALQNVFNSINQSLAP